MKIESDGETISRQFPIRLSIRPKVENYIAVVDDVETNLDLLNRILDERGYGVHPYSSGSSALEGIINNPPDLVLLDIMMPGMDGYEVCEKLKAKKRIQDIPVIFISAKAVTLDIVKAFNHGAVDYITKPFHAEEVLARVKTHLSLRQFQVEIEEKNRKLQSTLDELQSTQSQLIHTEKMSSIGVLVAGIAHELNNPINFVSTSSKGLKKKLKPVIELLQYFVGDDLVDQGFAAMYNRIADLELPSRLQAIDELINNIETGSERTVEVVNGLRSFSRLDSDRKEETDIHRSLESALVILQNQTKNRITIQRQYGDIPAIWGFPGRLAQVFLNILKNAIDAIDQKGGEAVGEITIETKPVGAEGRKQIKVSISDTGPGMGRTASGKLFDPFYTTKEVGKGTGLGLSIALGIIESHGGTIKVDQTSEKGTTFAVLLPMNE